MWNSAWLRTTIVAWTMVGVISACQRDTGTSVADCLELIEAGGAQMKTSCDRAYAGAPSDESAARIGLAFANRGNLAEVRRWASKAGDGLDAAKLWNAIGGLQAEGEQEPLEAYAQAEKRFEAGGDLVSAARAAFQQFDFEYKRQAFYPALVAAARAYELGKRSDSAAARQGTFSAIMGALMDIGDMVAYRALIEDVRPLVDADDDAFLALVHLCYGNEHSVRRRYGLARKSYERSLSHALKAQNDQHIRHARLNLAQVAIHTGDVEAAEGHLREVIPPSKESLKPSEKYWSAMLMLKKGDLDGASKRAAEGLGGDDMDEYWQYFFHRLRGRVEQARGRLDEARAGFAQALLLAERRRTSAGPTSARAIFDSKYREPLEDLAALEIDAGRIAEALQYAEAAKGRVFLEAFARSESLPAQPARAAAQRFARLKAAGSVLQARASTTAVGLPSVPPSTKFVMFLRTDADFLVLSGGHPSGLVARRAGGKPAQIEAWTRQLVAHPEDAETAAALGAALFPKGSLPPRGGPLYIIADDVLGRLPLGVITVNGQPLVSSFEMAYAPNLTTIAAWFKRSSSTPPAPATSMAPAPDLPGATAEAKWVADQLGGRLLLGSAASKAAFVESSAARVLHMAAHGELDGYETVIRLADGPLTSQDVLEAPGAPRFVVLASCSLAQRSGPDLWGALPTAFLAAGSQGVLAALWAVPDGPTRDFIKRFYELGGATNPRRALAMAQRQAQAAGEPPARWGAFVYLGR